MMGRWIAWVGLVLSACTLQPVTGVDTRNLFTDDRFSTRVVPDANVVFALSPEMERFLRDDLAAEIRRQGKAYGLARALQAKGALHLMYDATETRSAANTFAHRAGNCLSLVIMAGALARQLDLGVRFYQVHTAETWSRDGDLIFGNQHVNLSIIQRRNEQRVGDDAFRLSIDFLPPEDLRGQIRSEIAEHRVVAMYYNNRAAEQLAAGDLEDAYWLARAAIVADPGFVPAVNTLAVVYRRAHLLDASRLALERARLLEPENPSVLSNLERVLREQNEVALAAQVAGQLRSLEPVAPYHHYFLALDAMKRQDYAGARTSLERELRREPFNHEVHYGMAVVLAHLGDLDGAREHLRKARDHGTTAHSRRLYLSKLEKLQALRYGQPKPSH